MEQEGTLPCSQKPGTGPIQMSPVHNFPHYFRKIHPNIIFPSTPRSYDSFFLSGLSTETLYAFLVSPIGAVCPPISPSLTW
jgi:hypothetical protein